MSGRVGYKFMNIVQLWSKDERQSETISLWAFFNCGARMKDEVGPLIYKHCLIMERGWKTEWDHLLFFICGAGMKDRVGPLMNMV